MTTFSYEPLTYVAYVFNSWKLEELLGKFPDKDAGIKSLVSERFGISPFDLLELTCQLNTFLQNGRLLVYSDTHPIDDEIYLCLPKNSYAYNYENVMVFPFKGSYSSLRTHIIDWLNEIEIEPKEKKIYDYPALYTPATPLQFSQIVKKISSEIGEPITKFD